MLLLLDTVRAVTLTSCSLEMAESVQSLADKHASNADVQAVAAELQASLVSDTD